MSTAENTVSLSRILRSLGWPILWGVLATVAFYWLIAAGVIRQPLLERYCAGHPVEYCETAMFFVGMSALVIKVRDVVMQILMLHRVQLAMPQPGSADGKDVARLLESLARLPSGVRETYLVRRWHDALAHMQRRGNVDQLEDELKYLSDQDIARHYESYSLVRIVTWATPMLGFLGTVIGITMALGGLSPEALVNNPTQAMEGLLSGLSVAFDTTALALSLSMVLMFTQFLVSQLEMHLLSVVDRRTSLELAGSFRTSSVSRDPQVAAVQHMAQEVVGSVNQLVQRQVDLWHESLVSTQRECQQWLSLSGEYLMDGLARELSASLAQHARVLAESESALGNGAAQLLSGLREAIVICGDQIRSQQDAMSRQTDLLMQISQAVGNITQLEDALNHNLHALAQSQDFAQTVSTLSATIHLLNSRLSNLTDPPRRITLDSTSTTGRAA